MHFKGDLMCRSKYIWTLNTLFVYQMLNTAPLLLLLKVHDFNYDYMEYMISIKGILHFFFWK